MEAEIDRIGRELHARGQPTAMEILGWRTLYSPSTRLQWTWQTVDPFTGEHLDDPKVSESDTGATFIIGFGEPWAIRLWWRKGGDEPPSRFSKDGILPPEGAIVVQEQLDFTKPAKSSAGGAESFVEGTALAVDQDVYERNPEARRACLAHYGNRCFACSFDFVATYGDIADGVIHVHHVTPLSTFEGGHEVDPIRDLRPLCPNCHAVVHRRNPVLTPEELRTLIQKQG